MTHIISTSAPLSDYVEQITGQNVLSIAWLKYFILPYNDKIVIHEINKQSVLSFILQELLECVSYLFKYCAFVKEINIIKHSRIN